MSLIEILVCLGILGLIGLAFLSALWTTSNNTDIHAERITASALAQSRLEEIKSVSYLSDGNYDGVYPCNFTLPNYQVSTTAVLQEPDKQEITVAVSRGGHNLLQVKTIKANVIK